MEKIIALLDLSIARTFESLAHNWPYLLASIIVAAALKTFLKSDSVSAFLFRFRKAGVAAATVAAVTTPFCSCGTTAVVLGMMASTMPLAPIVAFMVASPLSSPQELFYSAGLFGWPFAIWFFASSIVLGLAGGAIASVLEGRGWLRGQTRLRTASGSRVVPAVSEPCCSTAVTEPCACSGQPRRTVRKAPHGPSRGMELLRSAAEIAGTLVPMFVGFAFLGYLLNGLIPASWIGAVFGQGTAYGVPLAASIGLPLYVSSEASLPLVRALLDSGMSQGAVMAFLIAGSGTSIGAITGALTIARWKVVSLIVAVLWIGAILSGWGYDALVASGIA